MTISSSGLADASPVFEHSKLLPSKLFPRKKGSIWHAERTLRIPDLPYGGLYKFKTLMN
jgi:hypothetical protein